MTDLISGPDAGNTTAAGGPSGPEHVQWAPNDAEPRKRRVGLWIGAGAGALVLAGAVTASVLLIAPGTTVAGVQVGFMTPGMAAEAISSRIASIEIEVAGAPGATLTGADLGAKVDAAALADQAFEDRRLFNIGAWMGEPITASVTLDPEVADSALRAAVPDSYVSPTDATVEFNAKAKKYVATPAVAGSGISLVDLTEAMDRALAAGDTTVEFTADAAEVAPTITDDKAAATVSKLNGILSKIGFYIGKERVVPVAPATAAEWLSVEQVDGELKISADEAKIQQVVDGLAKKIDRKVVDATLIVNSAGTTLRTLSEGASGRKLGDVSDVAPRFAEQLAEGNAVYDDLPVKEVPFATTSIVRKIEVNLSAQRLNMIENGKVVDSWAISSGKYGNDTQTGTYTVNWKLSSQDMGRRDLTVRPYYFQPNVKWVMYFNGDQALHGVYWHSNWGTRMSHGCVGMPESLAKKLYDWTPQGVEVWVHN